MSAVTANQLIKRQEGDKGNYPAAAANLYEGTLCFINASGYADVGTATGVNEFGGIVIDQCDNSAGSAGDKNVEVWAKGDFELTGDSFSQASVGLAVHATSNYDITLTPTTSSVRIGTVVKYVSSTKVIVKIDLGSGGFQGAALTAQLTTVTHTAPGTPDYAIQNLTTTTPYGFVTADEGNSVLKVIANLQVRMAEVEARLEAAGIVTTN